MVVIWVLVTVGVNALAATAVKAPYAIQRGEPS